MHSLRLHSGPDGARGEARTPRPPDALFHDPGAPADAPTMPGARRRRVS